jgi:hypothetical protein
MAERPAVSPHLTPADTLRQQCRQEESESDFAFVEYRLKQEGQPESLMAFVDFFFLENDTYNEDRIIWITENSFVRLTGGRWRNFRLPGTNHRLCFHLCLKRDSQHDHNVWIYSTTREEAISCLDFLLGLNDDYFNTMEIRYFDPLVIFADCPLTNRLLKKMILQNAKRHSCFNQMLFMPDQCRTLATSGTRSDIELNFCFFGEDGAAFVEASAAREDPETGLAKLTIRERLPFAEGILVLFLYQHMLEYLKLEEIVLKSEEACQALATIELQYLELRRCELADGGAALVESVREGRGPKGLGLCHSNDEAFHPFDSSERFVSFLNALRGNVYLERLDISNLRFSDGILGELAAAVLENEGLTHLGLDDCSLDESCWGELLSAVSTHPSLRTLSLTHAALDFDRTKATEAVADILLVNKRLEEIRIDGNRLSAFDSSAWDTLVTPRLECNIYRKRFPAIQKIRLPSTRAAVMARALAHVNNKPWLVWMLISQNHDILSSYQLVNPNLACDHQTPTLTRKRDRSPSLDAMVAHDDEASGKEP